MISIIVGLTKSRIIGKGNKLPWNIPEDLTNFKKITSGKTVLMGRKTFGSIGKPLSNRNNIVISSSMPEQKGIIICKNLMEGLEEAEKLGSEVFIIGGATIYGQALPLADRLYLSWMKNEYEGDVYFPEFNLNEWEIEQKKDFKEFEFIVYKRKP